MAHGLTLRQRHILGVIIEHIEAHGFPPSIREIGERSDIDSLRGVTIHLDALEHKRYIDRSASPRGIRVLRNVDGRQVRVKFQEVGHGAV